MDGNFWIISWILLCNSLGGNAFVLCNSINFVCIKVRNYAFFYLFYKNVTKQSTELLYLRATLQYYDDDIMKEQGGPEPTF